MKESKKLLGKTKVFSRVFHRKSQQKEELKRFFPCNRREKRFSIICYLVYTYILFLYNKMWFRIRPSVNFYKKNVYTFVRPAYFILVNPHFSHTKNCAHFCQSTLFGNILCTQLISAHQEGVSQARMLAGGQQSDEQLQYIHQESTFEI